MTTLTTATSTVTPSTFAAPSTAIVVNQRRFVDMLMGIRGAEPITFIARTTPKMKKTGNRFFGLVEKVARVNGMLNVNYDKAVERRLVKEGRDVADFQKGESWHEAIVRDDGTMTPLCRHKKTGDEYLRFVLNGTIESEYRWTNNDTPLSADDVAEMKEFLQISTYANQGTSDPIKFMTYSLASIKVATVEKQTYIIA